MWAYEQQIHEIEHGSFTPLVMSLTGGVGSAARTCYKRLAAMLAEKWDQAYAARRGASSAFLFCVQSFNVSLL